MNQVILSGRLVRDPELRQTMSNKAACSFSIAVYDGKDKDGNKKSIFVNCSAWDATAESIAQYFRKGSQILVSGKWEQNSYEKDGQKKKYDQVRVLKFEFMGNKEPQDAFAEVPDGNIDLPF